MKIFFSEYQSDYTTYTFGYTAYCVKEQTDSFSEIYEKGFLPFTGIQEIQASIFYMARSLRVNLSHFNNSSENRRISRKVAELDLAFNIYRKEDFNINEPSFRKICLDYAAARFVGNEMSENRFDYILSRETTTHIFEYLLNGKPFGYILTCIDDEMLHYWFAFFDTDLMTSHSIGKWMMWSVINWAKHQDLKHVYLGTAYNKKSLYKIRDFKGAEFFDGSGWNSKMSELKVLCKTDYLPRSIDRFKEQVSYDYLIPKSK